MSLTVNDFWTADNAPSAANTNVHIDNTVLYNGNPTIRIDPHTAADTNTTQESDGVWGTLASIDVQAGDHVQAAFAIKAASSPSNAQYFGALGGGRLGMDIYSEGNAYCVGSLPSGANQAPDGSTNPFPTTPIAPQIVQFGSQWTILTYDFIVPGGMYTWSYYTNAAFSPALPIGHLTLWLDVRPMPSDAPVYFCPLYINVNQGSTSTASPTGTPTQTSASTQTPAPVDNEITFVAGAGGGISWTDYTTGATGLNGTYGLTATDQLTMVATPLAGFVFVNFTWNVPATPMGGTTTTNPWSTSFGETTTGTVTVTANFTAAPTPTPTPTPAPSGSVSVGGTPYGGYMYLPKPLVRVLWRLREKYISKEVHRKLHPLV